MGILKGLLKTRQGKKKLGICIPDVTRKKIKKEMTDLEFAESLGSVPSFVVAGLYMVEDTLMLEGIVRTGVLERNAVADFGESQARIVDLQCGFKSVEKMSAGQRGAIFLAGAQSASIKRGDVIEFREAVQKQKQLKTASA